MKPQLLKLIILPALVLASFGLSFGQTAKVHGTLLEDGEVMKLQGISLYTSTKLVKTSMTSMNGEFEFALLDAGDYYIEVSDGDLFHRFYISLGPAETEPTTLEMSKSVVFDANGERVYKTNSVDIFAPREGEIVEIFSLDPHVADIIPHRELERIAGPRGVGSAIAMGGPGLYQADQGDALYVSGARDYGTAIYVDNVKVRGDYDVAQASINQIAFMNNGVPAAYGDLTGGVVVITTHNPGMKGSKGKRWTREERIQNRALRKGGLKEGGLLPAETMTI